MPAVFARSRREHVIARGDCAAPACGSLAMGSCPYVDQWGWRCAQSLCMGHGIALDDDIYCRRHAAYFLALGGEMPALPCEFDDPYLRRPSLATWLPRDLDKDVRNMLASVGQTGTAVDLGQTIHATESESILWETRWELTGASPHLSVSLVLEGYRDPTLIARVGAMVVMREVPEWLRHHLYGSLDGESDGRLRRELFRRMHNAMAASVQGGEEIEIELPGWSYLVLTPGDR